MPVSSRSAAGGRFTFYGACVDVIAMAVLRLDWAWTRTLGVRGPRDGGAHVGAGRHGDPGLDGQGQQIAQRLRQTSPTRALPGVERPAGMRDLRDRTKGRVQAPPRRPGPGPSEPCAKASSSTRRKWARKAWSPKTGASTSKTVPRTIANIDGRVHAGGEGACTFRVGNRSIDDFSETTRNENAQVGSGDLVRTRDEDKARRDPSGGGEPKGAP